MFAFCQARIWLRWTSDLGTLRIATTPECVYGDLSIFTEGLGGSLVELGVTNDLAFEVGDGQAGSIPIRSVRINRSRAQQRHKYAPHVLNGLGFLNLSQEQR